MAREIVFNVLKTKIDIKHAKHLGQLVSEAFLTVRKDEKIDLNMIEIITMQQGTVQDTQLIKGLVLDHGGRHPDMPKKLTNAYVLILNVSLEYEKTEINSGFYYRSPQEKQELIESERRFVDDKLKKIIELKNFVCGSTGKSFVIINQKGIDVLSLDVLAKNNILALRRAKRRNMERLQLACGGIAQNSCDHLTPEILGFADKVMEISLGDDKYTIVENHSKPSSVSILVKSSSRIYLKFYADAIKNALCALRAFTEEKHVVPGGGATFFRISRFLREEGSKDLSSKLEATVASFSDALNVIPRIIASNIGIDPYDSMEKMKSQQDPLIFDIVSRNFVECSKIELWDNVSVIRNIISSSCDLVKNLILIDEIIKAGRQMKS